MWKKKNENVNILKIKEKVKISTQIKLPIAQLTKVCYLLIPSK